MCSMSVVVCIGTYTLFALAFLSYGQRQIALSQSSAAAAALCVNLLVLLARVRVRVRVIGLGLGLGLEPAEVLGVLRRAQVRLDTFRVRDRDRDRVRVRVIGLGLPPVKKDCSFSTVSTPRSLVRYY